VGFVTGDGSGVWDVPDGVWYSISYTLGIVDPGNGGLWEWGSLGM